MNTFSETVPVLSHVGGCKLLWQTCVKANLFSNGHCLFLVITSSSIIGLEYPSGGAGGEIINYARREVPLPSQPSHLNVSCDQNYLVVAIKRDGCPHALIYNVPSFAAKVSNVCSKCFVASVTWNLWNLYWNFHCEWNNEWMDEQMNDWKIKWMSKLVLRTKLHWTMHSLVNWPYRGLVWRLEDMIDYNFNINLNIIKMDCKRVCCNDSDRE